VTDVVIGTARYRLLDRASKLCGLALVAAGLEVGGSTPTGLVLAGVGAFLAVITVFIDHE
jgi:hypothetical protein